MAQGAIGEVFSLGLLNRAEGAPSTLPGRSRPAEHFSQGIKNVLIHSLMWINHVCLSPCYLVTYG